MAPDDESADDAWVITVGDRVIRVVGVTEENLRAFLREALLIVLDTVRLDIRRMSPEERAGADDEDQS